MACTRDVSSVGVIGADVQTQGYPCDGLNCPSVVYPSRVPFQRKRKAGDFAIYQDSDGARSQSSETQSSEATEGGRGTAREAVNRDANKRLARETLQRLKRCTIPIPELPEYDADDKDDPSCCAEYLADMYKHHKELEVRPSSRSSLCPFDGGV